MNFKNYLEELKKIYVQGVVTKFYESHSSTFQFFKAIEIDGIIRWLSSQLPNILKGQVWKESLEEDLTDYLRWEILDKLKWLKDKISLYETNNSRVLLYKSKIDPIIHYIKNEMPVNAINETANQLCNLMEEYTQALVSQAEELIKNNQYEKAITCFEASIGLCTHKKDYKDLLVRRFEQTKKLAALNRKAQKAIDNKDYIKAFYIYNKIIALAPNNSIAKEERKKLIDRMLPEINYKPYKEAVDCYDAVLELDPNNIDCLLGKAKALHGLREWSGAITCYDKVLKFDPNNLDILKWEVDIFLHLNSPGRIVSCYNKILELEPNSIEILKAKANLLGSTGGYEEAIFCYDKLLELDPNNIHSLWEKRMILRTLKREEEAIDCLNKILEKDINDIVKHTKDITRLENIIKVLEPLKRYDEVDIYCDAILKLNPNDISGLSKKAELLCFFGTERYYKENNASLDLLDIRAHNVVLSDEVINCFDKAVYYYDKIFELTRKLDISSYNCKILDKKASLLMYLKRYEEVIICSDKILSAFLHDEAWKETIEKSFVQKTSALVELGRLKEAIDCCNEVLRETTSSIKREIAKAEKKRLKKLNGGWWPW